MKARIQPGWSGQDLQGFGRQDAAGLAHEAPTPSRLAASASAGRECLRPNSNLSLNIKFGVERGAKCVDLGVDPSPGLSPAIARMAVSMD